MDWERTTSKGFMKAIVDCKCSESVFENWVAEAFPGYVPSSGRIWIGGNTEIIHAAPEQWLVCAPIEEEADLLRAVRPDDNAAPMSLVEVSDAFRFFVVQGPDMLAQMSEMTSLNVRRMQVPSATFTEAYGLKAIVVRRADRFEVGFDSSYAAMIGDLLSSFDAPVRS